MRTQNCFVGTIAKAAIFILFFKYISIWERRGGVGGREREGEDLIFGKENGGHLKSFVEFEALEKKKRGDYNFYYLPVRNV